MVVPPNASLKKDEFGGFFMRFRKNIVHLTADFTFFRF